MSFRTIKVAPVGHPHSLILSVARTVRHERVRKGLLFKKTGRIFKKITVQYGIGIHGEGGTLKEAVADFQTRWAFFRDNHHEIVMGRMELI
jgi:hypothetical protein